MERPLNVRPIDDPPGITSARTLPAAWYSSADHHERELQSVFRDEWVCVGDVDDMPAPGAWRAISVGGLPVLLVRDREGVLRGFVNVCRHRAAPLCEHGGEGSGAALSCPYHAWLYRLDGTLARAQGVGNPDDFDVADYSLKPVSVSQFRRWVWIHADQTAVAPDFGPLADAIDAFPLESMDVVLAETDERAFNWKVLLENYSENYHTPFIHPEIDTSNTHDYPMVSDGLVLYAWDRPLHPTDEAGRVMAGLLPGEPGWEALAGADTGQPYAVGSYLTMWPNLMLNVFPDAALAMWMEPVAANRTVVHRRLYMRPGGDADARAANIAAHRLVHLQDIDICNAVQTSHDAGVSADGVLATVEERGVYWVHQHVRRAAGAGLQPARRIWGRGTIAETLLEDRGD
ncbi:MAG: aromatic ring-hydroxylating dioxygenase subunit alpha [Actinomycetota bacterium]|nr:aromatic ring-hydroxylating dioxygenase subunit alpha [Actinomycetota bacterium]